MLTGDGSSPVKKTEYAKVKYHRERMKALSQDFSTYKHTAKDIRDFIAPRTAKFEDENIRTRNYEREDQYIINTVSRLALRVLASGMMSGVTSPARPWFRLGTPDPDLMEYQPVKEWLYDCERRMFHLFGRSNLYNQLPGTYRQLGAYSNGSLVLLEDDEKIIRAQNLPFGSYFMAAGHTGRIDTNYRIISMTVRQIACAYCKTGEGGRYDTSKLSPMLQTLVANEKWETLVAIGHAVEPNPDYRPGSPFQEAKRFIAIYFEIDGNCEHVLKVEGFDENPVFSPRWDVNGDDVYGSGGPGDIALGDCKAIQLEERRKYQALDQLVDPTIVADASLRGQTIRAMPGGRIFANGLATGNQGARPLFQIDPHLGELGADIQMVEMRIKEGFYYNLFLLVSQIGDQPNITATQINTMREEKLLMLAPVLERLSSELLDPLIDRAFNIGVRRGFFDTEHIPEELMGMPLQVEYISILSQAQKALGIGALERFVQFSGSLAQVRPDVLDKIDLDQAIDEYGIMSGISPRVIVPDEKVGEIRQQRMKMQQAQQMAEQARNVTGAVKDLATAPIESNTALTTALGLSPV